MQPFELEARFIPQAEDGSGNEGWGFVLEAKGAEGPLIALAVHGELTTARKRDIIKAALALIQSCMPPGTVTEAQIKPVLVVAGEDVHAHVGDESDA